MKPPHERLLLTGPVGELEVVVADPGPARRGMALVAHPHPLYGGTMDNKVVQTLARTFLAQGQVVVRMNFRGVGASQGVHDDGRGETDDWVHVAGIMRGRFGDLPLTLAGFSFGGFVQTRVAKRLGGGRLVLVAPAVGRFEVEAAPPGSLVIHGDEDDVVPLSEVMGWARTHGLAVTVLPGAGHFFHGRLTDLQAILEYACPCRAAPPA